MEKSPIQLFRLFGHFSTNRRDGLSPNSCDHSLLSRIDVFVPIQSLVWSWRILGVELEDRKGEAVEHCGVCWIFGGGVKQGMT